MIIFLDSSGNIDSASSPDTIGRNSNDASNIYIVAPISSAAVIYLTFKLPNGETLFGGIADSGAELPTEEMAQKASWLFTTSGLSVWQYKLKSSITRLSGIVQYSIYTKTESMTASATGTFTVSKGNRVTLPETNPDFISEATLGEILGMISELKSDFKEKVDVSSQVKSVYATDIDGKGTMIPYETEPDAGTIVQRSGEGHIKLPLTPEADEDAASKKFVEDTASKVLPTSPTGNGDHVLGIKGGELKYIDVIADTPDPQNHAGAVVGYGGGGRVRVGDAVHDQDAANKRFVKTELLLKADALQEKPQDWLHDAYGLYLMDESGKQEVIAATDDDERLPYLNKPTIVMRDRYYPQCVSTGTPEAECHATPRWYVDSLILSGSYQSDGKLIIRLSDPSGETISDVSFDLPLEQFVQSGKMNEDGTKIILTLNTGNAVEIKVPEIVGGLASKDYVTNAVAGKLDKPTAEWKVPVSKGKDENGNVKYGTMTYTGTPQASAIPFWSANKTLKTEKAIDDNDTVNLAQLIEELAKKLNADTTSGSGYTVVYSRDAMGNQQLIPIIAGNQKDALARFTTKNHSTWGTKDDGGVLVTGYPPADKPFLCAPVKYVNDEDKKLSNRISELEASVGSILTTETVQEYAEGLELPSGALPNIYINHATTLVNVMNWETGEMLDQFEASATRVIYYGGDSGMTQLGEADISTPCFVSMPEGTKYISFNWSEVAGEGAPTAFDVSITCQILKVGG